jgi:hypothetical protein
LKDDGKVEIGTIALLGGFIAGLLCKFNEVNLSSSWRVSYCFGEYCSYQEAP